jgi:hypothetical protein
MGELDFKRERGCMLPESMSARACVSDFGGRFDVLPWNRTNDVGLDGITEKSQAVQEEQTTSNVGKHGEAVPCYNTCRKLQLVAHEIKNTRAAN